MFQSIYTTVISNIQKLLRKGSRWKIDYSLIMLLASQSIILAGSSFIKLTTELDHPRKGLINIQNIDNNECFK